MAKWVKSNTSPRHPRLPLYEHVGVLLCDMWATYTTHCVSCLVRRRSLGRGAVGTWEGGVGASRERLMRRTVGPYFLWLSRNATLALGGQAPRIYRTSRAMRFEHPLAAS